MEPYPQAIEHRWREHRRGAGQMGPVVAARRRNSSVAGRGSRQRERGEEMRAGRVTNACVFVFTWESGVTRA